MCTPDLKGTQGSFTQFTTRVETATLENGSRQPLKRSGHHLEGVIEGPEDLLLQGNGALQIPFRLVPRGDGTAAIEIDGESHLLKRGEYTPWIQLTVPAVFGAKVIGVAHFLLSDTWPEVSPYLSPININPENPSLPISHPGYYAVYLAKLLGTYATLGTAEDTWTLNEGVIDEAPFLKQGFLVFEEREAMFARALETTRRGVVARVLDTSDRVHHMFYRYLDSGKAAGPSAKHAGAIEQMCRRMHDRVGKTLAAVDEKTILFVLSDHGFCSVQRGGNLNSGLHQNGYLTILDGAEPGGRCFQGLGWSRTRAHSLGLSGRYLNLNGRERLGGVEPGPEAEALKLELAARLSNLQDPEREAMAIRQAYVTNALCKGPYLDATPDLIIGYSEGHRTSWDAAVGITTGEVLEDDTKAWSGDRCADPALVVRVLFSNRNIDAGAPGIEDLAPPVLERFGLERPAGVEGQPITQFDEGA
jgi:hypothetical protein